MWRLCASWSLLDVVQSVSQTKSNCFSGFLIDSVIFYLFSQVNIAHFTFFHHRFLCPGTGRFVRNRRRDFRQLNVAIPHVAFFLASALVSMLANAFFYRHLNMLAHRNIDQNKLIAIITEQISPGLVLSNQSQSLFRNRCRLCFAACN